MIEIDKTRQLKTTIPKSKTVVVFQILENCLVRLSRYGKQVEEVFVFSCILVTILNAEISSRSRMPSFCWRNLYKMLVPLCR